MMMMSLKMWIWKIQIFGNNFTVLKIIFIINLNPLYSIKLMTIVKEYLELTEKYKKEYGEKTLVLMQVGSFFEAYGLLDKDDNIYGSDIVTFAEINEMTISRKNICVGKSRVVMAGFGLPQLEKYIKKMQDNGYTIPVYTQMKLVNFQII